MKFIPKIGNFEIKKSPRKKITWKEIQEEAIKTRNTLYNVYCKEITKKLEKEKNKNKGLNRFIQDKTL